jgi:outer membrane protein assembly factor BamB
MRPYTVVKNIIKFASGSEVRFEYPVWGIAEFPDVLVVCLNVPRRKSYPDNVFGVDDSGRILWQIRPLVSLTQNAFYSDCARNGDVVEVFSVDGNLYEINPRTGEVLRSTFVK